MKDIIKKPVLLAIVGILIASACVMTVPVPGYNPTPEPPTPDLALTGQAQTVIAAPTLTSTFTSSPAPTFTETITLTWFPTITPLPTETLYVTSTITPTTGMVSDPTEAAEIMTMIAETPDFAGDPPGSQYACRLIEKKPANYAVYKPKQQFTAWWDLQNVGKKQWANGIVRFALWEGKRLAKDRKFELPYDVDAGQTVRLKLEIETPTEEGTYISIWGLQNMRTGRTFCFFTMKLVVKKP